MLQTLTLPSPLSLFLLGVSHLIPEAGVKAEHSLAHNISQLKHSNVNHQAPHHAHINGHHFHSPVASQDTAAPRENLSDEDEEESGQEEEEVDEHEEEEEAEEAPRKWQGIESIFEAYQEYVDGKSIFSLFYLFSLK